MRNFDILLSPSLKSLCTKYRVTCVWEAMELMWGHFDTRDLYCNRLNSGWHHRQTNGYNFHISKELRNYSSDVDIKSCANFNEWFDFRFMLYIALSFFVRLNFYIATVDTIAFLYFFFLRKNIIRHCKEYRKGGNCYLNCGVFDA